jgi:hypothetical protein
MPGPTLEQKLEHLMTGLAEAERRYAAGEPYPDQDHESWPKKIDQIKKHIAIIQEMIANE